MSDATWDPGAELLATVRERFAHAAERLERTLGALTDDEVGMRPNRASNSIGNLVTHLCGHLRAGYLGEAGQRDRAAEFLAEGPFRAAGLTALVQRTFAAMDAHLAHLATLDLSRQDVLAGVGEGPEGSLVRSLIYSLAHTTEHVGQVILLAKAQRPDGMEPLWGRPVRLPGGPADGR